MNMSAENIFKHLEHENSKAVISFNNGTTFRINKFMENLNKFFIESVLNNLSEKLKQAGLGTPPNHQGNWNRTVNAEILEPQSGEWKKGKVRMRVILEFCPDEPGEIEDNASHNGNSLDDIRQTIQ